MDEDDGEAREERTCGWCGKTLPPPEPGPGRRFQYCNDECRLKAKDARKAQRAAHVEEPLAAYRETSERLVDGIERLQALAGDVIDTMRNVDAGAVTRIAEEATRANDAIERAEAAQSAVRRAVSARKAAEAETREAREKARTAERLRRDAEAQRVKDVEAAWREVSEEKEKRGRADARANAAEANLTALQERFDRLGGEANDLRAENRTLVKQLAAAEAARDAAAHEREAAQQRAEHRASEASEAREARAGAEANERTARDELKQLRHEHDQLRQELERARARLARRTSAPRRRTATALRHTRRSRS